MLQGPRYTWKTITKWEIDALRSRVPTKIEGLVPRTRLPNNRFWFRKACSFERNGERTLLNNLGMQRIGIFLALTCLAGQIWRPAVSGYNVEQEHHNWNFDDIVYDKLSTRSMPYHTRAGFP
jgi:hypothetical protein